MMVIDPVCKMDVDETAAKFTTKHKGETYHNCCTRVQEGV